MKVFIPQAGVLHLVSYLEFLSMNNVSVASIANYISALKAMFAIYSLDLTPFSEHRLKYFNKAMFLNKPFRASLQKTIDIPILEKIVRQCNFMHMGQVFKALYLTALFYFLKISNPVHHSETA